MSLISQKDFNMVATENIKVTDLYLDIKNPRQESMSQEEAIEWLCENENIEKLAKDIIEYGLNPLELTGVTKEKGVWVVLEGNRRACALKLLAEPELSPNSKLRKKFNALKSEASSPISEINCISFPTREDADIWLDRLHQGEQGGLGRSQWNSIQQQRRMNGPTNKRALMVLDYAKEKGWVDDEEISRKLTTTTRFLNNQSLREAIGLGNNIDSIAHTRPIKVFDEALKRFMSDLINSSTNGPVSSRANKGKIEQYAELIEKDIQDKSIHDEILINPPSIGSPAKPTRKPRPKKPSAPPKPTISHDDDLAHALKLSGNTKLQSLYYSLCMIDLSKSDYVPLATVGLWSFVESLTHDVGRQDNQAFTGFINSIVKQQTPFTKDKLKEINQALEDLSHKGNATKHGSTYAFFNAEELASIMDTITPVLVYLLQNGSKEKMAGK